MVKGTIELVRNRAYRGALLATAGAVMLSGGGCDVLLQLLQPTTTSITLVNEGSFPVSATLFLSDQQEIPELLLTELGDEVNFTVPPGDSRRRVWTCDDLQAVILADADLNLIGSVGPEASSDVLRDGDDFRCGDEIVFTFTHSDLVIDFDVEVTVERGASGLIP